MAKLAVTVSGSPNSTISPCVRHPGQACTGTAPNHTEPRTNSATNGALKLPTNRLDLLSDFISILHARA